MGRREREAFASDRLSGGIGRSKSGRGENCPDDDLHLELSEARPQAAPDPAAERKPRLTLTLEESLGPEFTGV
jgi:hypothetical protein